MSGGQRPLAGARGWGAVEHRDCVGRGEHSRRSTAVLAAARGLPV